MAAVSDLQIGSHRTTFKASNSSGSHATDYIVVTVTGGGQSRSFWAALDTDPSVTVDVEVDDQVLGGTQVVRVCQNHGVTITEDPEPVQIHVTYPVQ